MYVIHRRFSSLARRASAPPWKALVWADPPEYYDPPGGLLVYDADVPENLLKNATSVEGHFNLVNHQLLQVRSALALAQKLGRVLVMPKLYCGFDRWWAPHEGGFRALRRPCRTCVRWITCSRWNHGFGPSLRRSSATSSTSGSTASLITTVSGVGEVLGGGGGACSQLLRRHVHTGHGGCRARRHKKVVAPKNLTDVDAMELLREHNKTKVIRFSSMVGTFGGFVDNAGAEKFSRRIKRYAAIWCCKAAHPGHIWYDMEFDVVPH